MQWSLRINVVIYLYSYSKMRYAIEAFRYQDLRLDSRKRGD